MTNKNACTCTTLDQKACCHSANAIVENETGNVLEYRHLITEESKTKEVWLQAFTNELGRLAQGITNNNTGTNTLQFIPYSQIPHDRRKDITYGRIVVDHRPHETEVHRARLTVGGDRINYPGLVTTPAADLISAKILINSTI